MPNWIEHIGLNRRRLFGVGVALFAWLATIVASGAGINVFPWNWNFSNTGAFGDSFAPLSAVMASIAAVGALAAYNSQIVEMRRIRDRDNERDRIEAEIRSRAISREFLSDERAEKQSFEATLFQLVELLRTQVHSLDVEIWAGEPRRGHDAFEAILLDFSSILAGGGNISDQWQELSIEHRNDLNHYFRLLYHIVRFIDKSPLQDKYFYMQIVRAMLSDSELALISLNCEYGHGREKFKSLVEKYALLHNLSDKEVQRWDLRNLYSPEAFNYIEDPSQYEFIESDAHSQ